ncbi:hypothetical protein [Vreelandella titanicae]|uniref:hypothetical protein n=1 Tax=Vreelandella titanicae TaxID=664683 RepID=UPI00380360D3
MANAKIPKKALNASNYDSLFIDNVFLWWYQSWIPTNNSTAKLQHIFYDAFNDAVRHEIELFSTLTGSYCKLTNCILRFKGVQTPFSLIFCYHDMVGDFTKAAFIRMRNASEYRDNFKEQLWTEL